MSHTPSELKELYQRGKNVSAVMRKDRGVACNTTEIGEVSYDLQAGSYVAAMADERLRAHKEAYGKAIAGKIASLCRPATVLEAGVGEATTMSVVLRNLDPDVQAFGFDLSWSRIAYAKQWLAQEGVRNAILCTGDLFRVPFADDSIDVIYTSHAIEPNGGRETDAIRELLRVARQYVLLLEPGYEFASAEGQSRMESHGYCRDLRGAAERLGCEVLCHQRFPFCENPLNPTALLLLRKRSEARPVKSILSCPQYNTPLREMAGVLYSDIALTAYPIIGGIPCLRVENGVLASALADGVTEAELH